MEKERRENYAKTEKIAKHESGMQLVDIARHFGKSTSMIRTILTDKDTIRKIDVAKGVAIMMKQLTQAMKDIEKLLLAWIHDSLSRKLGLKASPWPRSWMMLTRGS
ncbi:Homeobox domain-like [Trinorchestia longiramus]|nr:Homeobox domain-like [Trinorchestia longiramus]